MLLICVTENYFNSNGNTCRFFMFQSPSVCQSVCSDVIWPTDTCPGGQDGLLLGDIFLISALLLGDRARFDLWWELSSTPSTTDKFSIKSYFIQAKLIRIQNIHDCIIQRLRSLLWASFVVLNKSALSLVRKFADSHSFRSNVTLLILKHEMHRKSVFNE